MPTISIDNLVKKKIYSQHTPIHTAADEFNEGHVWMTLINGISFKFGRGEEYQSIAATMDNIGEDFVCTRETHTERIYYRAKFPDGTPDPDALPDDDMQYHDYEFIDRIVWVGPNGHRLSIGLVKPNDEYRHDDELGGKTHIKRVYMEGDAVYSQPELYPNDPERFPGDVWMDMLRYDELAVKFGTGEIYQEIVFKVDWSQVETYPDGRGEFWFDRFWTDPKDDKKNKMDRGGREFDWPWRYDLLQRPVNVHWGRAEFRYGWIKELGSPNQPGFFLLGGGFAGKTDPFTLAHSGPFFIDGNTSEGIAIRSAIGAASTALIREQNGWSPGEEPVPEGPAYPKDGSCASKTYGPTGETNAYYWTIGGTPDLSTVRGLWSGPALFNENPPSGDTRSNVSPLGPANQVIVAQPWLRSVASAPDEETGLCSGLYSQTFAFWYWDIIDVIDR